MGMEVPLSGKSGEMSAAVNSRASGCPDKSRRCMRSDTHWPKSSAPRIEGDSNTPSQPDSSRLAAVAEPARSNPRRDIPLMVRPLAPPAA